MADLALEALGLGQGRGAAVDLGGLEGPPGGITLRDKVANGVGVVLEPGAPGLTDARVEFRHRHAARILARPGRL